MANNILEEVSIVKNGNSYKYDLSHLKGLSITIEELNLNNGQSVKVKINLHITNHVYSRKLESTDSRPALNATGELLTRYKHEKGNTGKLVFENGRPAIHEYRTFDLIKYHQSKMMPFFIDYISKNITKKCILANGGDDSTSLSALFKMPGPYIITKAYLVIFTLKKVKNNNVNMLVETAFIDDIETDHRLQKLSDPKTKLEQNRLRPFTSLIINVLSGRKPFESSRSVGKKSKGKRQK
jgi:hypothetical protein